MSEQVQRDAKKTPQDYAKEPVATVYHDFGTSAAGLASDEAAKRLRQYGPNEIQKSKKQSQLKAFLKNFTSLMAWLLWVGGIIAVVAGMLELGIAIWAVNIINGVFSFWQEHAAQKATDSLMKMLPTYVNVHRDGQLKQIETTELVPGDVFDLQAGDAVPADAMLIQASSMQVDQSALTGESVPESKSVDYDPGEGQFAEANLIYEGTNVGAGTGTAVALATGMTTEFGKIAQLTQQQSHQDSPLTLELNRLTRQLSMIAIGIGILFFILAIFVVKYPVAKSFIFALGMIVAFIPEGLLPTVTLSLAQGVQRMAKKHALVKDLNSVETLGETTVICSDKTGTLTQNQMTVNHIWLPFREYGVKGTGYVANGKILRRGHHVHLKDEPELKTLLEISAIDNDTRVQPGDDPQGAPKLLGTPTEAAMIIMAEKGGIDADDLNKQMPRVKELTFDSVRKRMSTINKLPDGSLRINVKGSLGDMLTQCATVLDKGETIRPITDADKKAAMKAEQEYAESGLRTLAVAYRDIPADQVPANLDDLTIDNCETNLTLVGQAAMADPARPEIFQAVKECHDASIRIIMVTGDSPVVARNVAAQIGIVSSNQARVITGSELAAMSKDDLKAAFKDELIFARVAPEQKYKIVSTLQEMGEIVASTGDGVNDAPALKKANIGVAMGVTGTDVAKDAADMVLTDDNFASIVAAIEEGRTVYSNIQKFLTYILNSNVGEAIPSVLFLLSRGLIPLPLTVMQILTIDLGTDMLPALGLGAERAEPGAMKEPPRSQTSHLLTKNVLWRAFAWYGMIGALVSTCGYFFVNYLAGWPSVALAADGTRGYITATTMTLACVIFVQMANVMNCRTRNASVFSIGIWKNFKINVGIVVEFLILIALMHAPILQDVFQTGPLHWQEWVFLACIPLPVFFIEELRKKIVRGRRSSAQVE
ncbi:cation-translocating P-type ATPase [Lacticaseibacillus thailandensis]|uniref:Cation-transporting ATPase n=1 Tax=Lacticaseibacillus thailandensis DSM 22698 = JCM 13996 TaxID=1423810 RepID=A0A0R2C5U0_9LACO|nr:cation-transporting P-type ATPase [Lacticaseibacillus thailandensis]KRM86714.1 cation-transporting ATPase [Lacticaseibacillus thailandensis DSM 22698 = JCM 13996]